MPAWLSQRATCPSSTDRMAVNVALSESLASYRPGVRRYGAVGAVVATEYQLVATECRQALHGPP
jgi:hypothetical protein